MATRAINRNIFKSYIYREIGEIQLQANMEETDGERLLEWKLTTVDPQERSTWRSGVKSAMRAASQLPGKGPTDVDDAPAPAR